MSHIITPAEFSSPLIHRPVDDSCVLWFSGRGSRRSGTLLADLSKKANHGTIDGATWANGPVGQAVLSSDGIDNYVSVADNPSLQLTQGSIELWFKPTGGFDSSASVSEALIGKEGAGNNNGDFDIRLLDTNGRLSFNNENGVATNSVSSDSSSWNDQWYCVVTTFDGSGNMALYIDGIAQSDTDTSTALMSRSDTLYIGSLRAGTLFPFNGLIDEVRIYNRPKTASDISQRFQLMRHLYGV